MRVEHFKELFVRLDVPKVMHVDGDKAKRFSGTTGLLVLVIIAAQKSSLTVILAFILQYTIDPFCEESLRMILVR